MTAAAVISPTTIIKTAFPVYVVAEKAVDVLRLLHASRGAAPSRSATPATSPKPPLREGTFWYHAGQSSVTYEDVLVPYLADTDEIAIYDRYIRQSYQVRNLMELLEDVSRARQNRPTTVRLVTEPVRGDGAEALQQSQMLVDLQEVCARDGIRLTVTFEDAHHDRWIEAGQWKIVLGKGLDFWRATPREVGRLNPALRRQDVRIVGQTFTINYIRVD